MNFNSIFIDSWGWLALGHRRDSHHLEVKELYQELGNQQVKVYTSDYVLDEVITLLFRRENFSEATRFIDGLLSATNLNYLLVERIYSNRFDKAWILRKRFQDKPLISFTDLTSMVVMQELGISRILTDDDHFVRGLRLSGDSVGCVVWAPGETAAPQPELMVRLFRTRVAV